MKSYFVGLSLATTILGLCGLRLLATDFGDNATRNIATNNTQMPGLMLAKLASTQRLVSGLVSKDFNELKRGGEEMLRISDASQWESHPDSLYSQYRSELRNQAFKMTQMADEQNLEGAAFVYMQTVSTCINCHNHCRDVLRLAEVPLPRHRVVPIPTTDVEMNEPSMPILRR